MSSRGKYYSSKTLREVPTTGRYSLITDERAALRTGKGATRTNTGRRGEDSNAAVTFPRQQQLGVSSNESFGRLQVLQNLSASFCVVIDQLELVDMRAITAARIIPGL